VTNNWTSKKTRFEAGIAVVPGDATVFEKEINKRF
jgi:hypothetical protein